MSRSAPTTRKLLALSAFSLVLTPVQEHPTIPWTCEYDTPETAIRFEAGQTPGLALRACLLDCARRSAALGTDPSLCDETLEINHP